MLRYTPHSVKQVVVIIEFIMAASISLAAYMTTQLVLIIPIELCLPCVFASTDLVG